MMKGDLRRTNFCEKLGFERN